VFNILCSLRKENSILVTSGLHPIGQAAIAIGLAEKCETYAIVDSTQDLKLLSKIFPEVKQKITNNNRLYCVVIKICV